MGFRATREMCLVLYSTQKIPHPIDTGKNPGEEEKFRKAGAIFDFVGGKSSI